MILRMKFNHYAGIKTPKYMLIMLFSDNFIGLDGSMNNCCIHQCKYIPCHCNRSWIVLRTPVQVCTRPTKRPPLLIWYALWILNLWTYIHIQDHFTSGRFVTRKSVFIKILPRYAGLYFCICVDISDNNLFYLEAIHNFVEVMLDFDPKKQQQICTP